MSKRLWPAAIVLLLSGLLPAQVPPSALKFQIETARFDNITRLSSAQKTQLDRDLREQEFAGPGSSRDLAGSVEMAVLAAYADNGYWGAKVKVEVSPAHDPNDRKVRVSVRAIAEGRQYRLHQLLWHGVTAFSDKDLTPMVPVRSGRVLERVRINEGMEAVRRVYLGAGYLGYVAVPEVKKNDRDGTVDLLINVDEGGVFTVQGFDVIGLDQALRARLLQSWPFKPGDVYRGENIENFVYANAALLPGRAAADVVCRTVDLSNHTIEFVLDFRAQPLACTPPEQDLTRQTLNRVVPAQ